MQMDLKKQFTLALQCLSAIVPICEKAGIVTDYETAYDEWETLVQAVFESFIVLPVSDSSGQYSREEFGRLGFQVETGKRYFQFEFSGANYIVCDFIKNSGEMKIRACPLSSGCEIDMIEIFPSQCDHFAVALLRK